MTPAEAMAAAAKHSMDLYFHQISVCVECAPIVHTVSCAPDRKVEAMCDAVEVVAGEVESR